MKTASAITNRHQDFRILNLCRLVHHVEGRGPFMVTQDGCDPGDPTMRECSFVLTHRGTWLHFYLYLALPDAVRQRCAQFETVAEALQRADSLPSTVIVESAASLQEMLEQCGFEPAMEDLTGRALLREMRSRHGSRTPPQPTSEIPGP
jgi:hypothetical protein